MSAEIKTSPAPFSRDTAATSPSRTPASASRIAEVPAQLRTQVRRAVIDSYNDVASAWDRDPRRQALVRAVTTSLLQSVPLKKEWKVLDYGCGTGALAFSLLPHVAEITAADASIGMIAEATRKKLALPNDKDATRLTTLQLDLLETPPLSLKFDLIIASLVLHIIDDPDRILDAFRSMLADGGWVVIVDWAKPVATVPSQSAPPIKHRTSDEWAYALARVFIPKRIQCSIIHHFEREDGTIRPVFFLAAGPVPPLKAPGNPSSNHSSGLSTR